MGNGGQRRGAGRKPGAASKKTREIADREAVAGITPLEVMLATMRLMWDRAMKEENGKPRKEPEEKAAREAAAIAKDAAPYLHARISQRDEPVKLGPLTGTLADQGNKVLKALCGGQLTPTQAATVLQAVAAQARIIEVGDLAKRIKILEEQVNGKS